MPAGQTYTLRGDVFVIAPVSEPAGVAWAVAPGQTWNLFGSPLPGLAEWQRSHEPADVRGYLPAGTRLSFDGTVNPSAEDEALYCVFKVTGGPSDGQAICLNLLMTRHRPTEPYQRWSVTADPRYLRASP